MEFLFIILVFGIENVTYDQVVEEFHNFKREQYCSQVEKKCRMEVRFWKKQMEGREAQNYMITERNRVIRWETNREGRELETGT